MGQVIKVYFLYKTVSLYKEDVRNSSATEKKYLRKYRFGMNMGAIAITALLHILLAPQLQPF